MSKKTPFARLAATVGLGVSLFSYAGTLTVGVAADERLDLDPAGLAAAIQDEIAALGAREGRAEPPG